jgi:O-methyltransferase
MPAALLAHIHLRKCGGTSFAQLLDSHFGPRHLRLYPDDVYFVYTVEGLEERLRQAPGVQAFSSHHVRRFPRQLADRPARYVTFLRDPVEQFVSHMTHVQKHYAELTHESLLQSLPPDAPQLTLREFARWILTQDRDILFRENYTVNFLTRYNFPADAGTDRLSLAKAALEDFFFVGITGRMDECVRKLRRLAEFEGMEFPSKPIGVINASRDYRDDLSWIHKEDEVGAMLLESVREDRQLYDWAVQRLDEDYWTRSQCQQAAAPHLYLDFLKQTLTRVIFPEQYRPANPADVEELPPVFQSWLRERNLALVTPSPFDAARRAEGRDWPAEAETMIGLRRLHHLQHTIETVLGEGVPGDFLEAGVWRGGASIFMRAVLKAYGVTARKVWVADAFESVPLETVKDNFLKYGLLDGQVAFLAGGFQDTLPHAPVGQLALLRLAGDLYAPTMVALRALYPKLAAGGYILLDQYNSLESCRAAVDDFRAEFHIEEQPAPIDWAGICWRVEHPIPPIEDVLQPAGGLLEMEPERTTTLDYEPALRALLDVYEARPDLREAFPEAANWNFAGLIDWARHAAQGDLQDSAAHALQPFREWFERNAGDPTAAGAPPWTRMQLTSGLSANPLPRALARMRSPQSADINQQLTTLALLVTEFGLRQIVELGVRQGHSTVALLEAAEAVGGWVWSIDIEPCRKARQAIAGMGLADRWTFLQRNALAIEEAEIPRPIDLLLIDTLPLYSQALAELRKFMPYLRAGSWIALHETVSSPGVSQALGEALQSCAWKFCFYPFLHQHGLSLVRLIENGGPEVG